jgi:succinate dehydrogenase/fumarate reductase cytochrome b subunit
VSGVEVSGTRAGLRWPWARALRRLHALSAGVVGTFALVHLANHLAALGGIPRHTAFLQAARTVYRQPVLEALLLACVALQCASGLAMLATRPWPRLPLARCQAVAGLAVALFLLVHLVAVLGARRPPALETDFHFAAAGLHVPGWAGFFRAYYAGATVALFVHLGCAWERRQGVAAGWHRVGAMAGLGTLIALVIVGCLSGWLIDVEIPAGYLAPYVAPSHGLR